MLRSRIFIVAEPAFGGQLLQHKCRELTWSANRRSWATQLIDSIGCFSAQRVDLTIDSIVSRSKSKRVKSAYELAMERLEKDKPTIALANEQKEQLADVDSTYKAKIAERELFLRDEIRKAQAAGNFEEVEKLEKQLSSEIARLREDCERKKEKLRASFAK
jgi:hypothetical protein